MKRKLLCGLLAAVLCFGMAVPACADETEGFVVKKEVVPADHGAFNAGETVTYAITVEADENATIADPVITDEVDAGLSVIPSSVRITSDALMITENLSTERMLKVNLDQTEEIFREDYRTIQGTDSAVITFDVEINKNAPTGRIANSAVLSGTMPGFIDSMGPFASNTVTIDVVGAPAPDADAPAPGDAPDAAAPDASGDAQLDPHNETGDNAPLGAVCFFALFSLTACGLVLRNEKMTK